MVSSRNGKIPKNIMAIQGLKTRFAEVPNKRDERQFTVKNKTQKTNFVLQRNGFLVKRGQAQETTHVNGKSAQPQSWRRNESRSGQPKNTGEE